MPSDLEFFFFFWGGEWAGGTVNTKRSVADPTGGRLLTSWLLTSVVEELKLGIAVLQIQLGDLGES